MKRSFALTVVLFVSASCSGGSSTPPDPYPSCANGKYVLDDPSVNPNPFDANACREFMKAIPSIQNDAAKAPTIITPLAGALLPATPIAKVTWTPGQLASLDPPSFWQRLREELVLERTAHAAEDGGGDASSGLTGDAYVVIFRNPTVTDAKGELLRVMTTALELTPSDAGWAALQASGTVEVSVYGMRFAGGKIATGPYTTTQTRTFTIAQ